MMRGAMRRGAMRKADVSSTGQTAMIGDQSQGKETAMSHAATRSATAAARGRTG